MMGVPGTVSVLLGNGDGTFQPAVVYGSGGINTQSLQLADLNNDGKLDIVAANPCADTGCSSSSIGILLGNGDGTFKTATKILGNAIGIIKTADLNKDGKVDLITTACIAPGCAHGAISVRLGNGNGTFQSPVSYSSGGLRVTDLQVADLNKDKFPDVLVLTACADQPCGSGEVGVLLGNGNGTLQPVVVYDSGGPSAVSFDIGDFNKDGNTDLAVVHERCGDTCFSGTLAILLGNGDGSFQAAHTMLLPAPLAHTVRVSDLNGDLADDIVVTHCVLGTATGFACPSTAGIVDITLGNGDGTVPIVNGVAVISSSKLIAGTHAITASYLGNGLHSKSSSAVLSQVVH
jgi:VCBS repeat protein/Big-like domain-containing protein